MDLPSRRCAGQAALGGTHDRCDPARSWRAPSAAGTARTASARSTELMTLVPVNLRKPEEWTEKAHVGNVATGILVPLPIRTARPAADLPRGARPHGGEEGRPGRRRLAGPRRGVQRAAALARYLDDRSDVRQHRLHRHQRARHPGAALPGGRRDRRRLSVRAGRDAQPGQRRPLRLSRPLFIGIDSDERRCPTSSASRPPSSAPFASCRRRRGSSIGRRRDGGPRRAPPARAAAGGRVAGMRSTVGGGDRGRRPAAGGGGVRRAARRAPSLPALLRALPRRRRPRRRSRRGAVRPAAARPARGLLAAHPTDDLVRRVRTGQPLRLALDPAALRRRSTDVEAMVAYLQRLPGADWKHADVGWAIYVDRCAACHGPYGTPLGPPPEGVRPPRSLADPAFQASVSEADHDRGRAPRRARACRA